MEVLGAGTISTMTTFMVKHLSMFLIYINQESYYYTQLDQVKNHNNSTAGQSTFFVVALNHDHILSERIIIN